jgi:hypothetical protein
MLIAAAMQPPSLPELQSSNAKAAGPDGLTWPNGTDGP